jgi:crotonobetaine/carnitine-CoA ligase
MVCIENRQDLRIASFLRRAADENPDKTFLVFKDKVFSYSQFVDNVSRASRAFQGLGIGKGDKVCLLLPNCPEFLFAWLGLNQIGGVAVFINTALRPREVQYIANHSEAKALITATASVEWVAQQIASFPTLQHLPIPVEPSPACQTQSFREMLESNPPDFKEQHVDNEDVATFIYTSGTTGLPKAVMQTHQTYVLTGEAMPSWLGLKEGDRMFTCLPLFHINAQAYSVMGSIGARATLVLSEKFSASRFWDQIHASQATEFNLLGGMPLILLKQPANPVERTHSVRVAYTAPALTQQDHEAFECRFGVTLVVGYGMSEATFGCINPLDKNKRKIGSIGLPRAHPQFGNDLRIVDDAAGELPALRTGEITLRNASVMKGYYKDSVATQNTLRDGWLFTGDLAYQDQDGFVFFAGRKKDMIRLKGENVSAYEVEAVIDEHPDVQESAVIGIPSQLTDERIVAFVTRKSANTVVTEGDIISWCRERLAPFKVPAEVEFREALPRTPTQKVAKHVLRDEAIRKDGRI